MSATLETLEARLEALEARAKQEDESLLKQFGTIAKDAKPCFAPARTSMINGALSEALAQEIARSEAAAGYMVGICAWCRPAPKDPARAARTVHAAPNASHGICPACMKRMMA